MTRIRIIAAASMVLAAATSALAQIRGESTASFKDWRVACDNVHLCTAFGFAVGNDEGGAGPYLRLQRGGALEDSATVLIGLGWGEEAEGIPEGQQARLRIEGAGAPAEFTGVIDDEPESGAMLVRISDPALEQRFVETLKDGTRVAVSFADKDLGAISLSGSSAGLRWIDDRQGRTGGVTALVATGPASPSAMAHPPAEPVVRLVKPLGDDGELPTQLPKALLNRTDVRQCIEENANPEREFSERPQVDRLSRTEYLWGIPCGRGAYNFSYRYIIAGRDGSNARSPGLSGYDDTLVNGGLGEDGVLGAFAKGRGPGDCGDETAWAWDGRRFNLVRRAQMDDCVGVPSSLWPRLWTARTQ